MSESGLVLISSILGSLFGVIIIYILHYYGVI